MIVPTAVEVSCCCWTLFSSPLLMSVSTAPYRDSASPGFLMRTSVWSRSAASQQLPSSFSQKTLPQRLFQLPHFWYTTQTNIFLSNHSSLAHPPPPDLSRLLPFVWSRCALLCKWLFSSSPAQLHCSFQVLVVGSKQCGRSCLQQWLLLSEALFQYQHVWHKIFRVWTRVLWAWSNFHWSQRKFLLWL